MYLNKRKTEYTRRSAQSTAFVGFSSVPDPVQYLCTLYYNTGKRRKGQRIISLYSYSYRTATARRLLPFINTGKRQRIISLYNSIIISINFIFAFSFLLKTDKPKDLYCCVMPNYNMQLLSFLTPEEFGIIYYRRLPTHPLVYLPTHPYT